MEQRVYRDGLPRDAGSLIEDFQSVVAAPFKELYFDGMEVRAQYHLAESLAFLSAPLFAYLDYRVIRTGKLLEETKPQAWLHVLTWIGQTFLACFSAVYLVMHFSART